MPQELAAQAANVFAGKSPDVQRALIKEYLDPASDMRQDQERMRAFGFGIAQYVRLATKAESVSLGLLKAAQVQHLDLQQFCMDVTVWM